MYEIIYDDKKDIPTYDKKDVLKETYERHEYDGIHKARLTIYGLKTTSAYKQIDIDYLTGAIYRAIDNCKRILEFNNRHNIKDIQLIIKDLKYTNKTRNCLGCYIKSAKVYCTELNNK